MTDYNRVFLDTAPLIYFLDEASIYHEKAKETFSMLVENRNKFILSTITCMEYMVLPYRLSDENAIQRFWDFVFGCDIQIISVSKDIAITAAQIRAELPSFKAMDALQLSIAKKCNCQIFLTNDKQLKQFATLNYIVISEL